MFDEIGRYQGGQWRFRFVQWLTFQVAVEAIQGIRSRIDSLLELFCALAQMAADSMGFFTTQNPVFFLGPAWCTTG